MSRATFDMSDGTVIVFTDVIDIVPTKGGVKVRYMGPGEGEYTKALITSTEHEVTILSTAYEHYYWTEGP